MRLFIKLDQSSLYLAQSDAGDKGIFHFSVEKCVLVGVRRRAAAQKSQIFGFRSDLVPRSCGNENRISGSNLPGLSFDFHEATAREDKVDLLAGPMVVAFSAATDWQRSFREALIFNGCVAMVENTADR